MLRSAFAFFLFTSFCMTGHAAVTSARARAQVRFRKACDDGNGRACYDYARALWNTPGSDRKVSRKYFVRGCELKYAPACEAYTQHNAINRRTTRHTKSLPASEGPSGPCFTTADLESSQFHPNMISKSAVHGQLMTGITPSSFWDGAGFKDGDVLIKVNNLPVNTQEQILRVFNSTGQKFSFQVERNHELITLWYTCN